MFNSNSFSSSSESGYGYNDNGVVKNEDDYYAENPR